MYEKYMQIALELAKKGEGFVNPNPMVGAVVVKNDKIIGQGYHMRYGDAHAEVNALNEAGEEAEGAEIYVTLEPCSHYGKTPPCADKIINSGIKKCIISMKDPNPIVAGKGIRKLQDAGIEVISGILEEESSNLNEVFIKYITTKQPYIFLKNAITLDGKIATKTGDSKWITNEIAREEVQMLRHKYMGIMVGANTVKKDNPRLTARIENGVNPYRIVIDSEFITEEEQNLIVGNSDEKTIIVTSMDNKEISKTKKFIEKKVKFIFLSGKKFDLKEIMIEIGKMGIDSILIEGGSEVISKSFQEKIIDKGVIFVAPKITGDTNSLSFIKGFDIEKMSESIKLKNVKYKICGDNIGIWFEGVE